MSEPRYDIRLDLTDGTESFRSETTIAFRCQRPGARTFIEFIGPAVDRIELNGDALPASAFDGGRIELGDLQEQNVLKVSGTAKHMRDGTGLHRFVDPLDGRTYLHTHFESNDAHRVFACFDQPDIKGTFTFQVKAPADWTVVSNTEGAKSDGGVWRFPTTKVISTYLAAMVAGDYHAVHRPHGNIALGMYCRQSLARYLDPDEIVEITRAGLDFFEARYAIPYMFGKYDQVFVPEFSAGAMENPGCVTFNERYIFRSRVTQASRRRRAETILHEMAHMWFGDLVTMRWFDDLWLNESFATYMGSLASAEATRFKDAWTFFAAETKVVARTQDELPTTHPIVADIPDVDSVHLNFDPITYNKGGAVLKQLAALLGDDAFFKGVHTYLERHAYGNATLSDFLEALEDASGRDLRPWSRLWLEEAGLNTLAAELEVVDGRITSAAVVQSAPALHPLRPHRLRVGVFDSNGSALERRRAVELDVDGPRTVVPQLVGERAPDVVLVNDGDLAYAKVEIDARSLGVLTKSRMALDDGLARALVWGDLWDMVRDSRLRAREYVAMSLQCIDVEADPSVILPLIGRVFAAFEKFADPARRGVLREALARGADERLQRMAPGSDLQLLWTNAFIDAARQPADVTWVAGLLDGTTRLEGLAVGFAVRWAAVTARATIGAAGPEAIADELERDPTDIGWRHAAAARSARPVPEAKAEAWEAVTGDGRLALATKRAIAEGFHRPDQEPLLAAYVQPYFETLLPFWESHDIDEALMFVKSMYPVTIITPDVVELVDTWLARDLPGPMRRSLLESHDNTKRALRTRAFDSDQELRP